MFVVVRLSPMSGLTKKVDTNQRLPENPKTTKYSASQMMQMEAVEGMVLTQLNYR